MPRPPGYPRRATALTKRQREQQARWLELLRQPQPQAAPEREHKENKP